MGSQAEKVTKQLYNNSPSCRTRQPPFIANCLVTLINILSIFILLHSTSTTLLQTKARHETIIQKIPVSPCSRHSPDPSGSSSHLVLVHAEQFTTNLTTTRRLTGISSDFRQNYRTVHLRPFCSRRTALRDILDHGGAINASPFPAFADQRKHPFGGGKNQKFLSLS